MQKLMTLKFAFFATALTVCVLPTSTAYSYEDTGCPQKVRQVEDCACPAQLGSKEDCACPQAETYVCGPATAPKKHKRVSYTLDPRPEEYQASERMKLFDEEEIRAAKDRDGSIFGGRPCKSCTKNGSIFGGRPCKTCDKNGSIFGGGPCKGPHCVEKQQKKYTQNYIVFEDDLYGDNYHKCSDLAPLQLEWVDFRIKKGMTTAGYSRKLGKYRFRIFGCRRNIKNAILNEGRILEKDMNFVEIFDDMVSDCYKIIKTPNDLCLREDSPLPEYVLTAEISDYYMNLCDEYDWENAKNANKRIGSSEMTVIWRLMDLNKTNVLWKGESTGYAEVQEGEYKGELVLIQRAFADAVNNLRNLPGFEDQLATRVSPEEMQRQRDSLIDLQRHMDPIKCQFSKEIKIMEKSGVVSSGYGMNEGWLNVPETHKVDEAGNISIDKVNAAPVEDFGSVSTGSGAQEALNNTSVQEVKQNAIGNVGVVSDGSGTNELYEVAAVEPQPSDMTAMFEKEKLCIREQPDYDNMGPENVYKVRTAVVSVTNAQGKKGAGLIISEQFVMTSADLIDRQNNSYALETINGIKLKARAFRINPKKNTALLVLEKDTTYTPLSLNLTLPAVEKDDFMSLGLLNFEDGVHEGYLDINAKVSGYRYDADGTSQIVVDAFAQTSSIGGVLIDSRGRITGMAHRAPANVKEPDLFLPIETAMKSLGIEICGKPFPKTTPKPQRAWRQKSVAPLIENTQQKAPEVMKVQDRK